MHVNLVETPDELIGLYSLIKKIPSIDLSTELYMANAFTGRFKVYTLHDDETLGSVGIALIDFNTPGNAHFVAVYAPKRGADFMKLLKPIFKYWNCKTMSAVSRYNTENWHGLKRDYVVYKGDV